MMHHNVNLKLKKGSVYLCPVRICSKPVIKLKYDIDLSSGGFIKACDILKFKKGQWIEPRAGERLDCFSCFSLISYHDLLDKRYWLI